ATEFFVSSIKQLNVEQLKALLGQSKAQTYILDVRQPEEYREGHIAGAKLIPLGELGRRMQDLPRSREIVCVCHSGSRSSAAARQLAAAGYQVANLRGGMIAWNRAGLPVKKSAA
ncbi:MAG TPA: rhodanese-like domain-containing protein, partial [Anaerolineales bacterium]